MAVRILLEVNAHPGTGGALVETFADILPATRAYEGSLGATLHQNQDDHDNLVLIEHWESKAHYAAYLAWRQDTGVLAALGASCSGPPSIRYYDETDS
jgi:quinol monooxygenase YgiN